MLIDRCCLILFHLLLYISIICILINFHWHDEIRYVGFISFLLCVLCVLYICRNLASLRKNNKYLYNHGLNRRREKYIMFLR